MRSFYTTYRDLRLFILGVPESWQVALFDLRTKQWVNAGGWTDGALKDAKLQAVTEVERILGRKLPQLKWR